MVSTRGRAEHPQGPDLDHRGLPGLSKWPDLLSKMMAQLGGREEAWQPPGRPARAAGGDPDFLFMILESTRKTPRSARRGRALQAV